MASLDSKHEASHAERAWLKAAMLCFLKDVKPAIPAFGWIRFRELKSLLSRHRCLSAAVCLNQAQTPTFILY